jgi:hypothetical protein
VVQRSPESADQDGMGRRWAGRSLLVAGFAAVIVTAGLGQTKKTAQTPSTPSQPLAGRCVGTGMERACIPASTQSGGPEAYCISAVSDGHWAYIDGPGGHLIDDPAATTDPCERPTVNEVRGNEGADRSLRVGGHSGTLAQPSVRGR